MPSRGSDVLLIENMCILLYLSLDVVNRILLSLSLKRYPGNDNIRFFFLSHGLCNIWGLHLLSTVLPGITHSDLKGVSERVGSRMSAEAVTPPNTMCSSCTTSGVDLGTPRLVFHLEGTEYETSKFHFALRRYVEVWKKHFSHSNGLWLGQI